jgi:glutamate racemase
MKSPSIGVFDSGIGGLPILREINKLLPVERIQYFADQSHVPYGLRTLEEVRSYCVGISEFLLKMGSRLIVVACNTASAAALEFLRTRFPETPFVGMEPAVKPAVQTSRTQKVGVLATPATFQGELFASVMERFAQGVQVMEQTLPGLVEKIELGDFDSSETRAILSNAILPLINQGVDTLVLACTHYPFVMPVIKEIAGPDIQVIDPAPAIARQTKRLWDLMGLPQPGMREDHVIYYSTGDPERLSRTALNLIHLKGKALGAEWRNGSLFLLERN